MEFILQSKITFHPHVRHTQRHTGRERERDISRVIARVFIFPILWLFYLLASLLLRMFVNFMCVYYWAYFHSISRKSIKLRRFAVISLSLSHSFLSYSIFIPFFPISIARTFLSFTYYVILRQKKTRKPNEERENSGFRHHRSYIVVVVIIISISIIVPCLVLLEAKWSKRTQKIETICKRSSNTILCA